MARLALALALALLALAGCRRAAPAAPDAAPALRPEDVRLEGPTMGSTWHVRIRADTPARADEARALLGPIEALLERVNDAMSTYRPQSEISRFNASRSTAPFPVSRELALVAAKAVEIGRATGGAFDVTVDPLVNLWGFDRKGPRTTVPSAAEIAQARRHTGLDLFAVEAGALRKADPETTINLGGIASGFAVDEVAALLASKGFASWMVEVTGEVRARGRNSRDTPWTIGVKWPELGRPDALVAIPLEDKALTTSGTYHKFFEVGGRRYSHILDPTTGAPTESELVSVTVLADDALTADAWDTALLILGEARARALLATRPGLEALFMKQDPDGGIRVTTTDGFPKPLEGR